MPATITTEVYTLGELIERGDDRAVERALDWMLQAWADITVECVSDALADALSAMPGMRLEGWDYHRHEVSIEGDLFVDDLSATDESHPLHDLLAAPPVCHPDSAVFRLSFRTSRARDYGGTLWLDMREDAPFGWADPQYGPLLDEVGEWLREIEARLSIVMREEYDYCTSREYLLECAEANGYTFTVDGKRFG
jgi:hypothetical protein